MPVCLEVVISFVALQAKVQYNSVLYGLQRAMDIWLSINGVTQ